MSYWLAIPAALLFVLAAWAYMNHWYRRVHGVSLRWPYLWAAHGAVMFARRYPQWEKRG